MLKAKSSKDKVFAEIQTLKTQKRLIENKIYKSRRNSSKGITFPLKIDITVSQMNIKDSILLKSDTENDLLEISYRIDNGRDYYESQRVPLQNTIKWNDIFRFDIMNDNQMLFIQVILIEKNTGGMKVADTFDIRANEIATGIIKKR